MQLTIIAHYREERIKLVRYMWPRFLAHPVFLETTIIDLHFAADSLGLASFNFFLVGTVKVFFPQECVLAVQGHPRSSILVPIESAYATSY